MTAADKPRADLVALLLSFEASAMGSASLYIGGPEAAAAIRAWADLRGYRVAIRKPTRVSDGKTLEWTSYLVEGPADPILPRWEVRCSLHDDREVTAPAAQADQQVLARVKAALDGEPAPCPECDGPADHCADCGAPNGRPHEAFCHQQPEAAGGSV